MIAVENLEVLHLPVLSSHHPVQISIKQVGEIVNPPCMHFAAEPVVQKVKRIEWKNELTAAYANQLYQSPEIQIDFSSSNIEDIHNNLISTIFVTCKELGEERWTPQYHELPPVSMKTVVLWSRTIN